MTTVGDLKRPLDAEEEASSKKACLEVSDGKTGEDGGQQGDELKRTKTHEEEFDELFEGGFLDEPLKAPVAPEEAARREFAETIAQKGYRVDEEELPELLTVIHEKAPSWGEQKERRSAAFLIGCIARSTRACRISFVAQDGLKLLGAVLKEAVRRLSGTEGREEAGMVTLACLACLKALPLGRASLWEHRQAIGKPFDELHKWCAKERSALAAELRAPTLELCKRWKRQPKPAAQEQSPEDKAMRRRVVELISQGLQGFGGASPASPAGPLPSPAQLPNNLVAVEVENLLWGKYGKAKVADYRHHARMLRSNLSQSGNSELRGRVLSGALKPEELIAMDSNALAPEEVRKKREEAQEKAMRESVVEELIPLHLQDGDNSAFDRGADLNTAPVVWVSPSKEKEKAKKEEVEEDSPSQKDALRMLPPPTPFTLSTPAPAPPTVDVSTPEMMATPGPDDDDEDELSVLRYLSAPP
ncbi:unnamed protein product [Durusdinium trenchii]|uniref:TFIIS central domain-containing protein n=1 Tax=Durusdinium trenchii TaxID=1381693 RepID=A0ABP0P4W2_9DINO